MKQKTTTHAYGQLLFQIGGYSTSEGPRHMHNKTRLVVCSLLRWAMADDAIDEVGFSIAVGCLWLGEAFLRLGRPAEHGEPQVAVLQ